MPSANAWESRGSQYIGKSFDYSILGLEQQIKSHSLDVGTIKQMARMVEKGARRPGSYFQLFSLRLHFIFFNEERQD